MIKFEPHGVYEANITAQVWLALKIAGFECYLEYTHENCRFDCVVVKDNSIFVIIEIKRFKAKELKTLKSTLYQKQFVKYSLFETPVLLINHANQIPKLIRRVKRLSEVKERTPINGNPEAIEANR